ncbi:MAG: hypothetical protein IAF08_15975 [Rhizobacter sp.]|nr:hypothetical protein [Chlorobiales bacterium]
MMTTTEFKKLERQVEKLTPKQKEKLRQVLAQEEGRRELLRRIAAVEAGEPLVSFTPEEWKEFSKPDLAAQTRREYLEKKHQVRAARD